MPARPALQILPILNNKGGVGKTTTSVNLASELAQRGYKVLLVDLDGQRSASLALDGNARAYEGPTSADLLSGTTSFLRARRPTSIPNVDIIPGSMALAQADTILDRSSSRVSRLTQVLLPARAHYHYILLDCAPSMSLLNINAIVAADALITPLAPSFLSIQGLISFEHILRRIQRAMSRVAPILGILLTNVERNAPMHSQVEQALRGKYGGKVFDTVIRSGDEFDGASARHMSVTDYAPDSYGAQDYQGFVDEVINRQERYASLFARGPAEMDRKLEDAVEDAAVSASQEAMAMAA